jgi:hypothetical protein
LKLIHAAVMRWRFCVRRLMRLETGNRQLSAMALYETLGFKRIAHSEHT